jgi:hypothetical protein
VAASSPWRTALRTVLTLGPPVVGVVLIGQAVVVSIGGDIRRWEFALGAALIVIGFAGRYVTSRGT